MALDHCLHRLLCRLDDLLDHRRPDQSRSSGFPTRSSGCWLRHPILTGSLSRIFLGIWTDQYGGRVVYTATMVLAAIATFILLLRDDL